MESTHSSTWPGTPARWSWSVTGAGSSPPWCKARTRCPRRPRPWSRCSPTRPATCWTSVAQGLASGHTTVTVQQVFPLDQLQAAFDTFVQGTLGKVVITTD